MNSDKELKAWDCKDIIEWLKFIKFPSLDEKVWEEQCNSGEDLMPGILDEEILEVEYKIQVRSHRLFLLYKIQILFEKIIYDDEKVIYDFWDIDEVANWVGTQKFKINNLNEITFRNNQVNGASLREFNHDILIQNYNMDKKSQRNKFLMQIKILFNINDEKQQISDSTKSFVSQNTYQNLEFDDKNKKEQKFSNLNSISFDESSFIGKGFDQSSFQIDENFQNELSFLQQESLYVQCEDFVQNIIQQYYNNKENQKKSYFSKILQILKNKLDYENFSESQVLALLYNKFISSENQSIEVQKNCLLGILYFLQPFNLKEFLLLSEQTLSQVENVKDKDLFMVIGETGAGKSTFIQYIAGSKMKKVNHINLTDENDKFDPQKNSEYQQISVEEYAKIVKGDLKSIEISHVAVSCTKFINTIEFEYYDQENQENLQIVISDSPGFRDLRGVTQDVANQYGLALVYKYCKSIVPIILLSSQDKGSRMTGYQSICKNLQKMFEYSQDLEDSLQIIFTKFNENDKKSIVPEIMDLKSQNQEQNFFIDILAKKIKKFDDILFMEPFVSDNRQKIIQQLLFAQQFHKIQNAKDVINVQLSEESKRDLEQQVRFNLKAINNLGIQKNEFHIIEKKLHELNVLQEKLGHTFLQEGYYNAIKIIQDSAKELHNNCKYQQNQNQDYSIDQNLLEKIKINKEKVQKLKIIIEKNKKKIEIEPQQFDEIIYKQLQKFMEFLSDKEKEFKDEQLIEESVQQILQSIQVIHQNYDSQEAHDECKKILLIIKNRILKISLDIEVGTKCENFDIGKISDKLFLIIKFNNNFKQLQIEKDNFDEKIEFLKAQIKKKVIQEYENLNAIIINIFKYLTMDDEEQQNLKQSIGKIQEFKKTQKIIEIFGENEFCLIDPLEQIAINFQDTINDINQVLDDNQNDQNQNIQIKKINGCKIQMMLLDSIQKVIEIPKQQSKNYNKLLIKFLNIFDKLSINIEKIIANNYQLDQNNFDKNIETYLNQLKELLWLDDFDQLQTIELRINTIVEKINILMKYICDEGIKAYDQQNFSLMNNHLQLMLGFKNDSFKNNFTQEINQKINIFIDDITQFQNQNDPEVKSLKLENYLEKFRAYQDGFRNWYAILPKIKEVFRKYTEYLHQFSLENYQIKKLDENSNQEQILKVINLMDKNQEISLKYKLLQNEIDIQNIIQKNIDTLQNTQLKIELMIISFKDQENLQQLQIIYTTLGKMTVLDKYLKDQGKKFQIIQSNLYQFMKEIQDVQLLNLKNNLDSFQYKEVFTSLYQNWEMIYFINKGVDLINSSLKKQISDVNSIKQIDINQGYQQLLYIIYGHIKNIKCAVDNIELIIIDNEEFLKSKNLIQYQNLVQCKQKSNVCLQTNIQKFNEVFKAFIQQILEKNQNLLFLEAYNEAKQIKNIAEETSDILNQENKTMAQQLQDNLTQFIYNFVNEYSDNKNYDNRLKILMNNLQNLNIYQSELLKLKLILQQQIQSKIKIIQNDNYIKLKESIQKYFPDDIVDDMLAEFEGKKLQNNLCNNQKDNQQDIQADDEKIQQQKMQAENVKEKQETTLAQIEKVKQPEIPTKIQENQKDETFVDTKNIDSKQNSEIDSYDDDEGILEYLILQLKISQSKYHQDKQIALFIDQLQSYIAIKYQNNQNILSKANFFKILESGYLINFYNRYEIRLSNLQSRRQAFLDFYESKYDFEEFGPQNKQIYFNKIQEHIFEEDHQYEIYNKHFLSILKINDDMIDQCLMHHMMTVNENEMDILYSLKSPFIYEGHLSPDEINNDFIQASEEVIQILPLFQTNMIEKKEQKQNRISYFQLYDYLFQDYFTFVMNKDYFGNKNGIQLYKLVEDKIFDNIIKKILLCIQQLQESE